MCREESINYINFVGNFIDKIETRKISYLMSLFALSLRVVRIHGAFTTELQSRQFHVNTTSPNSLLYQVQRFYAS